eukprot:GHVN01085265.1.p1 GENE.GHVN01085265.1~~GHVN01085265.1.p1  ORF type:complete len:646 (+),score=125.04 GHVN01085265.1:1108-3045(+)
MLVASLLTNSISCTFMAVSMNRYTLFMSRFLIGLTQSSFVIYAPVWVDEFAPAYWLTLWMGLVQGATVVGVMVGYLVAGYINSGGVSWRYAIVIQAAVVFSCALVFAITPRKYINLEKRGSLLEGSEWNRHKQGGAHNSSNGDTTGTTSVDERGDIGAGGGGGGGGVIVSHRVRTNAKASQLDYCVNEDGHREDSEGRTVTDDGLPTANRYFDPQPHSTFLGIEPFKTRPHTMIPSTSPAGTVFEGMEVASHVDDPFIVRMRSNAETPRVVEAGEGALGLMSEGSTQVDTKVGVNGDGYSGIGTGSGTGTSLPNGQVPAHTIGRPVGERELKSGAHQRQGDTPQVMSAVSGEQVRKELNQVSQVTGHQRSKEKQESTGRLLRMLLGNPIYFWTVFAISGLLYVVTGVQYWSTAYFIEVLGVASELVLVGFSAVAASAPTVGVLLGGIVTDRIGGYKSKTGMYKSLLLCSGFGMSAAACGIICGFMDNFMVALLFVWLLLFFGAAMFPASTGILIAAVDPKHRAFASGLSMFTFNIFGYALGSFLPGVMITLVGLKHGMKMVFGGSLVGVAGIILSTFFAWKDQKGSCSELVVNNEFDDHEAINVVSEVDGRERWGEGSEASEVEGSERWGEGREGGENISPEENL